MPPAGPLLGKILGAVAQPPRYGGHARLLPAHAVAKSVIGPEVPSCQQDDHDRDHDGERNERDGFERAIGSKSHDGHSQDDQERHRTPERPIDPVPTMPAGALQLDVSVDAPGPHLFPPCMMADPKADRPTQQIGPRRQRFPWPIRGRGLANIPAVSAVVGKAWGAPSPLAAPAFRGFHVR
jgi:hypothetical protein